MSDAESRSRVDYLREARDGLQARLRVCESDQNYAVMTRELRSVLAEIDDLGGGEQSERKATGLSDFEKRLAERESGAKGSRRAAGS